jgi:4-oxalocrotonate tautomerase
MPYVRIEITDEEVTDGAKAEVIAGVTELLQRVLGKDPEATFVVIDEVPLANWGIGGVPVTEWRQRSIARTIVGGDATEFE